MRRDLEIGTRLRKIRKRAGLTADQVAEAIGLGRSIVFGWESGDYSADPERIRAYLTACNATEAELLELLELRSRPAVGP